MKRVVSNPGGEGDQLMVTSPTEPPSTAPAGNLATTSEGQGTVPMETTPANGEGNQPPTIVECDDINMENAYPVATIPNHESRTSTSGSSLSSDASPDDDAVMTRNDSVAVPREGGGGAPLVPQYTAGGHLIRNDSKVSAESSGESSHRASRDGSGNWGWFEDVHGAGDGASNENKKKQKKKSLLLQHLGDPAVITATMTPSSFHSFQDSSAAMAITAPNYVLEESLSSQKLWKHTAGNRPPQPVEERAFYEKMWAQNFARSQVNYQMPTEVLTAASPISLSPFVDGNFEGDGRGTELSNYNLAADGDKGGVAEAIDRKDFGSRSYEPHYKQTQEINKKVKGTGSDVDLTVLVKGDNVFGTTVSKSFHYTGRSGNIDGVDTVNISIASYRVVESKKSGKYAQFLVIYREGSIRDTIGVWKRFSDFKELSDKVTQAHESCTSVLANMSPLAMTEEHEVEHLPNAITSWRLLKKRQRWYRCLDAGYLSLKVFLLERFLHDILFESSTPTLLREFIGTDAIREALKA